ncbi:hypothetical protein PR048_023079 [Dryococelus australis]|uniref:Uncharacterized protein n=1 Tax=Dryococelus australis TaxID=614101 RepID=A0ABQ9GT61_9NEOP|nr:hypothetical protein PR048_023079 [Dryococelus australis]
MRCEYWGCFCSLWQEELLGIALQASRKEEGQNVREACPSDDGTGSEVLQVKKERDSLVVLEGNGWDMSDAGNKQQQPQPQGTVVEQGVQQIQVRAHLSK